MSRDDQIHPVNGSENQRFFNVFSRKHALQKNLETDWKPGCIQGGDSNSIGGHEKRSGRTTFCVQRDKPHKTPLFTGLHLESAGNFIRR